MTPPPVPARRLSRLARLAAADVRQGAAARELAPARRRTARVLDLTHDLTGDVPPVGFGPTLSVV
jgi:hypothetical protein